jgi:hypothetical protein
MENVYLPVILSSRLRDILMRINDNISSFFLSMEDNQDYAFQYSFFDITEDESTMSFIQANKYQEIPQIRGNGDMVWSCNSRNEIRIGRLINKIAPFYTPSEIEKWVNAFKAEYKNALKNIKFKIVDRYDIAKYYNGKKYSCGNGSLNKSCMRYDQCENYMELYIRNPDKIKMLILQEGKGDLIAGRAILWKLDEPKDTWLLDRIYVKEDSDVILFKKHAEKQGWLYKASQTFDATKVVKEGFEVDINMKVNINGENFKYFPYIDTLLYYNIKEKYLTNVEKEYDSVPHMIKLRETNGGDSGNENFVYDILNKEFINIEDSVYCYYGDGYTHKNNAFFIKEFDEYVYPTELRYSTYHKRFLTSQSSVYSEHIGSFMIGGEVYKVNLDKNGKSYDYFLRNKVNEDYGCVNGKFYLMDLLVKGVDNEYYFKDEYDEKKILEIKNADKKSLDELIKNNSYVREMMGLTNKEDKKKKKKDKKDVPGSHPGPIRYFGQQ